jgi:hypothetical protein
MGIFDNQNAGNYTFAPGEGKEAVTFIVTGELKRITCDDNNRKFSYKKLVNGNQTAYGYFDILEIDADKKLLINTWKLYFALKECNPSIGDVIKVSHPKKGEYLVTKVV